MLSKATEIFFLLTQISLQQAIIMDVAKSTYKKKLLPVSALAIYPIYIFIIRYILTQSIFIMISYIFILILSYWIIFRQNFTKSCLMGIGQMVLVTGVEYFSLIIFALIGDELRALCQKYPAFLGILGVLVLILAKSVVRKININIQSMNYQKQRKNTWIFYLIYLLLYSLPFVIRYEINLYEVPSPIDIYNLILFLSFFAYSSIYIRNLNKTIGISQQLEAEQIYSETMEQAFNELHNFKHDFANIINNINGYLSLERLPELRAYMKPLTLKYQKLQTSDILNTHFKEIPLLYAIMWSKLQYAESKDILFEIAVTKIDINYCNTFDFSRIMGILIDNALESAELSEKKFVSLRSLTQHGVTRITIQNSCCDKVDTNLIFQKSYSTKTNHTGLGLYTVISTIKKYQNKGLAMDLSAIYENLELTLVLTI